MQSITSVNFATQSQVKTWLRAGVHIEVRERGEVIADLVPRTPPKPAVEWPDFEARAKRDLRRPCPSSVDDLIRIGGGSRY